MIPAGLKKLIMLAQEKSATDVHICVGAPVLFRVGRDLLPSGPGKVTPQLAEQLVTGMLSEEQNAQFRKKLDYDLMIADDEGRYRVNVSFNDGSMGLVIRLLPEQARSIEELGLPDIVRKLADHTKGLVLITGSTSQGKTATMSAMINEINLHRRRHIVTIEDPIETVHPNLKSVIRQREIGRDTQSFYSGLRAALRQDPDVIAIGEMRDYETIKIALTAAETGVLVLSTLHVISIDKLLERLLSYAPAEDQGHLRFLLAGAMQGVVHQELLPAIDGGKAVACEVIVATDAVRNIIRNRDSFMLRNIINTGSRYGMMTMRQSVTDLLEAGKISADVAENVLTNY